MKPFGEKLKELRKAANITQTALADRLNVHLQTVSKWERGISEPDLSLLGELSAVLGVSLEKLLSAPESGETYVGSFSAAAFGKAVAARRKERGRSQEEFAREIGVSADAVSKWERGVICPRAEELVKIASVAGIPVSKLYYAISEEDRTESVIAAKRRKKFSLLWFAAAANGAKNFRFYGSPRRRGRRRWALFSCAMTAKTSLSAAIRVYPWGQTPPNSVKRSAADCRSK